MKNYVKIGRCSRTELIMFYTYVLKSKKSGKFYTGYTTAEVLPVLYGIIPYEIADAYNTHDFINKFYE